MTRKEQLRMDSWQHDAEVTERQLRHLLDWLQKYYPDVRKDYAEYALTKYINKEELDTV